MAEHVYRWFKLESRLEHCMRRPPSPEEDQCKVRVQEATKDNILTLQRRGRKFITIPENAEIVAKAYPSYRAPMRELMNFFILKNKFDEEFGNSTLPNPDIDKIQMPGLSHDQSIQAVFGYLDQLINFISHGRIFPGNTLMEDSLEKTIQAAIFMFAVPALGKKVIRVINRFKSDPALRQRLSPEAKKRMNWILSINKSREKLWSLMEPKWKKDTSGQLEPAMKKTSADLLVFLFANHLSTEDGFNTLVFNNNAKEAAEFYHQAMSGEEMHDVSKNYYRLMASLIPQLKVLKIPNSYGKVFLERNLAVSQAYKTAARDEMKRLLAAMKPERSYREYLLIRYGDTAFRRVALKIILRHSKYEPKREPPLVVDMEMASEDLKSWFSMQREMPRKREALRAIEFMLTTLFHRGGEIEVYWKRNIQEQENFYNSVDDSRIALERLITWWRIQAETRGIKPTEESKPRESLRKTTLGIELGIGGLGVACALLCPGEGNGGHYARGGAAVAGGAGLGSGLGNLGQYLTNSSKNKWIWDVAGGIVGGLAGGFIYGAVADKPGESGSRDDGDGGLRNPVDTWGP